MAREPKKPDTSQPAEDMFGRPTGLRHEEGEARPRELDHVWTLDAQYAQGPRPHEEDEEYGSLDELSDGDGLRSDLGTNPLPEVYWAAYPGGHKPDDER
jgi:hypothetical protein